MNPGEVTTVIMQFNLPNLPNPMGDQRVPGPTVMNTYGTATS